MVPERTPASQTPTRVDDVDVGPVRGARPVGGVWRWFHGSLRPIVLLQAPAQQQQQQQKEAHQSAGEGAHGCLRAENSEASSSHSLITGRGGRRVSGWVLHEHSVSCLVRLRTKKKTLAEDQEGEEEEAGEGKEDNR